MGDTSTKWVDREKQQRSSRITDDTWEHHKDVLCRLYKTYTLAVVMLYMKKQYAFEPSKRQYGYRFEKWGIKKYGSLEKKGMARNLINNQDVPVEQIVGDFFDAQGDINPVSFGSTSFLDVPHNSARRPSSNASATSATSENDASFGDDEITDVEDVVSTPGTPLPPIRYPWGHSEDAKKLVADFCAFMSDDRNAFVLYTELFDLLSNAPDSEPIAKNMIITSIARVADDPKNATRARELLQSHRAQIPSNIYDQPFLFSMLDATMEGQEEAANKDEVNRRICNAIQMVLDDKEMLRGIPHNYSAIDLVTYHFLSTGLEAYEKARSAESGRRPMSSIEDLIYRYVYKQPFANAIRNGETSVLHDCVTWCAKQLTLNHKIPAEVASIPCPLEQSQWRDNVQLYCVLWSAMLFAVQNDTPPPWYIPCESALGISPSELLITVCWMIGFDASEPESTKDILQRASPVVEAMSKLQEGELWIQFLKRFNWMNKLVDLKEEDKAFEAVIVQHTRRFVYATVKVELPFPAEDPQPQTPTLESFEIDFGPFASGPGHGNGSLLDEYDTLGMEL